MAYGWLVQESAGGVRQLVLYVGRRIEWSAEYSGSLHRRGAWLVRKLLALRESSRPPPPLRNAKCSYCSFRRICLEEGNAIIL
ncbi:MAG: hypothetical protein ACPLSP_05295 [Fervidicoccus fontis]